MFGHIEEWMDLGVIEQFENMPMCISPLILVLNEKIKAFRELARPHNSQ